MKQHKAPVPTWGRQMSLMFEPSKVDEMNGRGSFVLRLCRVGYIGAGLRSLAMVRKRAWSGQAEAKATWTRVAVSMTRVAILRRRKVANSAVASDAPLGMACWMRHMSQNAAV